MDTLFTLRTNCSFRTDITLVTFVTFFSLITFITLVSFGDSDIKYSSLRSSRIRNNSICSWFSSCYFSDSNSTSFSLLSLFTLVTFVTFFTLVTFVTFRNSNVDKAGTLSFVKFYSSRSFILIYCSYFTNFNICRCIFNSFLKLVHFLFGEHCTGLDVLFESLAIIVDIIIIWFIIISHKNTSLLLISIALLFAITRMFKKQVP